jgi:hypothetical protein
MAFQGNHYLATFTVDGATQSVDVYAKDDTDARKKVLMLYPTATNITVSAGA